MTTPSIDKELAEEFNLSEESMYDEGAPRNPESIKRLIIILVLFLLFIAAMLGAFFGWTWLQKRTQKDGVIESELLKTISLTYRFEDTEPIAVSNIRTLAAKKFGQEIINQTEETEIIYRKSYQMSPEQTSDLAYIEAIDNYEVLKDKKVNLEIYVERETMELEIEFINNAYFDPIARYEELKSYIEGKLEKSSKMSFRTWLKEELRKDLRTLSINDLKRRTVIQRAEAEIDENTHLIVKYRVKLIEDL